MNRGLKTYLQKCGRATVDDTMLQDLRREMEQAVPEIAETISRREALAAKLRMTATKTSESNGEKQD